MKKFLLLAFVLLLLSMLMACSTEKKEDDGKGASKGEEKEKNTGSVVEEGKPERKELTIDIFIDGPADANLPSNPNDDFVRQAIEEKFNVKLQVDYSPLGAEYNNQINARFAAGDPPHMWRDSNGDGGTKYALDGLLADQTPFVSKDSMPNYFTHWVEEEEYSRYQFLAYDKNLRSPIPIDRNAYWTYYIRKDWLDQVGLSVPTNYNEYLEALRAFRNNDPNQSGKKDTYGLTLAGNGSSMSIDWPEFYVHGLTLGLFVEDNQLIDNRVTPKMKDVIEDVLKVIDEGLVDPDWFLNKGTDKEDKAVQGRAGVFLGYAKNVAFDSNPQSIQNRTRQLFPNANWVPFLLDDAAPIRTQPAFGNPFLFAKSVAEQNPEKIERVVEILDWLASEEGFLLTHFGVEGKHYNRSGNKIELNLAAFNQDIIKKGNFLDIWNFFTPRSPEIFGLEVINPDETDRDREIIQFLVNQPTRPNIGTNVSAPEGFDLGSYRGKMNEYHVKMIFDDKSAEKWPAYLEDLLTNYKGQVMMDAYTEQVRAVGVIK